MRIKDNIFVLSIFDGVIMDCGGYTGIHHSKYWMPIHYDTIEDGQNKNLIFYSLNKESISCSIGTENHPVETFQNISTGAGVWMMKRMDK